MDNANTEKLKLVLEKYGVPDPKIVGKLPKGGMQLDYVSHAEITRILLEVDPHWRWVPIAWDNGRPAVHVENGIATMWGELTILGQSRLGVGSVRADKQELDKELVGDFLRNAAMRFGIALSLWSKQEWDDAGESPTPASPRVITAGSKVAKASSRLAAKAIEVANEPSFLSDAQVAQFEGACVKSKLDPNAVAERAGVTWGEPIPSEKLNDLRLAYKEMTQ